MVGPRCVVIMPYRTSVFGRRPTVLAAVLGYRAGILGAGYLVVAFVFGFRYRELSYVVMAVLFLGYHGDFESVVTDACVLGSTTFAPVLNTFYSPLLNEVCYHDDDTRLCFPNHSPEVGNRLLQRSLKYAE